MKDKVLKRRVTKENFYEMYYKALNGYLSLTPREFEILVGFCNIQAQHSNLDYTPEQLSKLIFGPTSREKIRTQLGISPYNLNNVLKVLKSKKIILTREDGTYYISPQIYVPLNETEYSVQFKFEVINDDSR